MPEEKCEQYVFIQFDFIYHFCKMLFFSYCKCIIHFGILCTKAIFVIFFFIVAIEKKYTSTEQKYNNTPVEKQIFQKKPYKTFSLDNL